MNWVGKYAALGFGYALWQSFRHKGEEIELQNVRSAFAEIDPEDFFDKIIEIQRTVFAAGFQQRMAWIIHQKQNELFVYSFELNHAEKSLSHALLMDAQDVFYHLKITNESFIEDVWLQRDEPLILFWNERVDASFYCLLSEFIEILNNIEC